MVHGSASKPEAFLNSEQTAMFSRLAQNLEAFYVKSSGINSDDSRENGIIIENFTISLDATLTNDNVTQTGYSLADALMDGIRRTGASVNMKK
jgi:hypothetical protein